MKKILMLVFAGLAFITATTILIANREFTAAVLDESGAAVPGHIAVMDRIELGGVEQSLLVRGASPDLPVLLWLHGGPGSPESPFAREFNAGLERHFLVVHWDQRGAGKSFPKDPEALSADGMRLRENFVADTIELSERLIRRFRGQAPASDRKIYLFGHSWGALLGVLAAKERPDLYHALITAGQPVHMAESERRSYEWALARARETDNSDAVAELEAIGPPPYSAEAMPEKTPVHWKWIMQQGGALHGRTSIAPLLPILLLCDEYNLVDKVAFVQGAARTAPLVWGQFMAADLAREAPVLKVPVWMLFGRHDRQVDPKLSREYFERLRAPKKTWVWFEQSAHSVMFEEPARFESVLREIKESRF
ncbi:MAG: alpha/beta hydrolase [Leptospirales bacterium]|jgi:proline iminopeptidase